MPETKETNPKDSVGVRKVPLSTVPAPVLLEVGLAMLEGARKYGRHNYRIAGVRASVYYDAVFRHLMAWWEGEDIDPDSGLPHIIKAIACLVVLRDSMILGNWSDDRPPKSPDNFIKDLNKLASKIIDDYPNAEAPFCNVSLSTQKPQDLNSEGKTGHSSLVPVPNQENCEGGDFVSILVLDRLESAKMH